VKTNRSAAPYIGRVLCGLLACSAGIQTVRADWYGSLKQMVSESATTFDFRYRYEFVDSDAYENHANASTLRSRLTWTSGALGRWTTGVEADYVSRIASGKYNSLANGEILYPVVADPTGFDLNQAYVRYASDDLSGTLGRQRINHGNQRFVGGVAWRQNEQTFDALRGTLGRKLSFDYAYVTQVERVFGPEGGAQPAEWDSNSHLFRTVWSLTESQSVSAYGYLLDFSNANGPANSNATLGIAYNGKLGPVSIAAAVAHQSDYADNPTSYDADYYFLEGSFDAGPIGLLLGYEVLGSDDGVAGFSTPLATLHKFQGWADLFLATPADGVRDAYLGLDGKLGRLALAAIYHDFRADSGGADYGREIDLQAGFPLHESLSLQLKYARYDADRYATDTTKFWVTLQLKI